MALLNYKINNCILVSAYGKEYKKISDVPESEYLNIHTIKDICVEILKTEDLFIKIEKFKNLRFISVDFKYWNNLSNEQIIKNLALFQKLSILALIDYQRMSYTICDIGCFIFENKMTIFNPNINDFKIITPDINFLNIVNSQDCNYVNIPDTIQYLHLSIIKLRNYKQTNLPFGLKTLTITIPEIYNKSVSSFEINTIITSNTKLPFGCELIIDNIFK